MNLLRDMLETLFHSTPEGQKYIKLSNDIANKDIGRKVSSRTISQRKRRLMARRTGEYKK